MGSTTSGAGQCTACAAPFTRDQPAVDHPLLHVPICCICWHNYNIGEFTQANGNEIYCRLCGEGEGSLLLCDVCPKSFCERCIINSVGLPELHRIHSISTRWNCFFCNPLPFKDMCSKMAAGQWLNTSTVEACITPHTQTSPTPQTEAPGSHTLPTTATPPSPPRAAQTPASHPPPPQPPPTHPPTLPLSMGDVAVVQSTIAKVTTFVGILGTHKFIDEPSLQAILTEAFVAAADEYGIRAAQEWADGYTFPPALLARDAATTSLASAQTARHPYSTNASLSTGCTLALDLRARQYPMSAPQTSVTSAQWRPRGSSYTSPPASRPPLPRRSYATGTYRSHRPAIRC
jgi:hypothetical protein